MTPVATVASGLKRDPSPFYLYQTFPLRSYATMGNFGDYDVRLDPWEVEYGRGNLVMFEVPRA